MGARTIEDLLGLQQKVLEMVATGSPATDTLESLCRLVEDLVADSVCSSMLLDAETGRLSVEAAPRVPPGARSELDGTVPAELAGSCGTAAHTRTAVYVTDTLTDPRWADLRDLAEEFSIRACWSVPILLKDDVAGTFAISFGEPRVPTEFDKQLLQVSARLAGIAIARQRSEEERWKLDAKVQHAQKLESLAVLTGGIAHDFNNLLVGILGNSDLALHELSEDAPARERIKMTMIAAGSAAELCQQMLAYAGKGLVEFEVLDLNEVVKEVGHLLGSSISKKVSLAFNFAINLPGIEADGAQIRQIVMNLILNGAESLGEQSGVLSISTGTTDLTREEHREFVVGERLTEGEYTYLEVADNGCGMSQETQARMFDPFFSTKVSGRGLGLAAVHSIVRSHGGAVEVQSVMGSGTRIRILLPSFGEKTRPLRLRSTEAATVSSSARKVLVVDDEEMVCNVARAMLERSGFEVLTAADGIEAVEVFHDHADEIGCVLLDLGMPRMDGEEAFHEIRRAHPGVQVLLISGYGAREVVDRFAGKGLAGFVSKPFESETLVREVREAMESA